MNKYLITDCNACIVGNPKGYRTFKGAEQQANREGSRAIWASFNLQSELLAVAGVLPENGLIYSIKLQVKPVLLTILGI